MASELTIKLSDELERDLKDSGIDFEAQIVAMQTKVGNHAAGERVKLALVKLAALPSAQQNAAIAAVNAVFDEYCKQVGEVPTTVGQQIVDRLHTNASAFVMNAAPEANSTKSISSVVKNILTYFGG